MAETCLLAEAAICYPPLYDELRNLTPLPTDTVETVAIAAVAAAAEQGACAIVVLSTSGNTARLVAKYRPNVPIITGGCPEANGPSSGLLTPDTVTRNDQTSRQLHLHRACYPVWYPEPRGIESHQWQTDVRIVYPASEVLCALTCFPSKGGQPHPIRLEGWFEIESDPARKHNRCRPGLEGWSWTHQHDEDFVRPQ